MKKLLLLTFSFLTLNLLGQSTLFKVITSQGDVKVTTNGASTKISSGQRLNSGSKIKVGFNSYLGLIHISGSTMEVKHSGEYQVTDLAKKFSTEQSSFTGKYADYVVSKMTSSDENAKSYNYTGAVKRDIAGAKEIVLWAPSESTENVVNLLQTVPVEINWGKVEGINSYVVRIISFDESQILLTKTTTENSLKLDLSKVQPSTDIPYFIEVSAKDNGQKVIHSKKPFFLLDKESSNAISQNLNKVRSNLDTETALGNLILASFYEENGFTMYAISSYQKAVDLEPNVTEYKEMRNIYFNNHQVLFTE
jgi:hypothetical protein